MSKKDALDRYYTPQATADACNTELIDAMRRLGLLPEVTIQFDPSGGGGSFLKRRAFGVPTMALDKDPHAASLRTSDYNLDGDFGRIGDASSEECRWLEQTIDETDCTGMVITKNPPFGGPSIGRGREPGDPPYLGMHHVLLALEMRPVALGAILPLEWRGVGYLRTHLFDPFPDHYHRIIYPRPWAGSRAMMWCVWFPRLDQKAKSRERPPIYWKK